MTSVHFGNLTYFFSTMRGRIVAPEDTKVHVADGDKGRINYFYNYGRCLIISDWLSSPEVGERESPVSKPMNVCVCVYNTLMVCGYIRVRSGYDVGKIMDDSVK